jgi:hypothetical protein
MKHRELELWVPAALFLFTTATVLGAVHCVDLDSTNATPPYTNWITAATVIQDAVDAAAEGDVVVVTNGTYSTGRRGNVGGSGWVVLVSSSDLATWTPIRTNGTAAAQTFLDRTALTQPEQFYRLRQQ